jgi:hypothetical protein
MAESEVPATERAALSDLRDEVGGFFSEIEHEQPRGEPVEGADANEDSPVIWRERALEIPPPMSPAAQAKSERLARRIRLLMVDISGSARRAALLGEADLRDLGQYTKVMAAAVRFRRYRYYPLYIHHDEDTVLGVTPASQDEDETLSVDEARRIFSNACGKVLEVVDLVSPSAEDKPKSGEASRYTPDTAFIMMQIDKGKPELEDVLDTVADVFGQFGISARRADEIEHDDVITNRVLAEIEGCEFLFADLTGGRPSVYYEVGYAHALKKRVILYRKKDTRIHFDLAHRNCPEYENMRELRQLLTKRLSAMTGKEPKEPRKPERE